MYTHRRTPFALLPTSEAAYGLGNDRGRRWQGLMVLDYGVSYVAAVHASPSAAPDILELRQVDTAIFHHQSSAACTSHHGPRLRALTSIHSGLV